MTPLSAAQSRTADATRVSSTVCRSEADRRPLAQERHAEHGANAAPFLGLVPGVLRVGEHVGDMDNPALDRDAPRQRAAPRADRVRLDEGLELGREAVVRGKVIEIAV